MDIFHSVMLPFLCSHMRFPLSLISNSLHQTASVVTVFNHLGSEDQGVHGVYADCTYGESS